MTATQIEDDCAALVEDELTVLESIYGDLVSVQLNASQRPGKLLNLSIPIVLPSLASVHLVAASNHAGPSNPSKSLPEATVELSHLPPITARILLPPSYPLVSAPKIRSIRAPLPAGQVGSWLSKHVLTHVQDKLSRIWEEEREMAGEGSGVLWRWWEWVGSGEFLRDLEMMTGDDLRLSSPPTLPPSSFHTLLKTYNAAQLHSDFEQTAFSCTICFENRKGKSCIQMPECGCVFCSPCLSSCWTLAINEGTLENVSCPSISCTKTRATRDTRANKPLLGTSDADPELVESVVGKDLRSRWETLKEKRLAEIDPTYTTCPQPFCQASVPPPPVLAATETEVPQTSQKRAIRLSDITKTASNGTLPTPPPTPDTPLAVAAAKEDRWERYRICPSCHFSFCLYCSATWHGPHTPCAFPQTSAIVIEYLSYPEGSDGRRRMEIQKGKGNLDRMVAKWREDEENKKWLNERTRACAGCGVRVEKSHGCNHMTCGRCSAHFCYRCGESISPQDPYAHYRRMGTPCFEKLFDAEEIARFERETAMREGIGLPFVGDGEVADEWREVRGIWEW